MFIVQIKLSDGDRKLDNRDTLLAEIQVIEITFEQIDILVRVLQEDYTMRVYYVILSD